MKLICSLLCFAVALVTNAAVTVSGNTAFLGSVQIGSTVSPVFPPSPGGYFTTNIVGSPTIYLYRTIDGGVFCENNLGHLSAVYWRGAAETNKHQYFGGLTNGAMTKGTIAMRMKYTSSMTQNPGPIQTGDVSATGNYAYIQILTGTSYFDWGLGDERISVAVPAAVGEWFNAIYTKDGTNQCIWFGTNLVAQGARTSQVTNAPAGDLRLMQGFVNTNQMCKRMLLFDQGLSTNGVAELNTFMTSLP